MGNRNRMIVRKTSLKDQGNDDDLRNFSMAERLAMMWPITVDAWSIKDPDACQRRLPRHVVRVERRGR